MSKAKKRQVKKKKNEDFGDELRGLVAWRGREEESVCRDLSFLAPCAPQMRTREIVYGGNKLL